MSSPPEIRPGAAGNTPPLWLLVLITFSGTLAMHVFVPALPAAARDLDASPGTIQLTISMYVLGLGFGQLFYGPLSDRFGRRPVLMAGLAVYTAAGLAAAVAPSSTALIAIRLVQGLGGCAGLALGRAIVRDTSTADTAVRRLALVNLMVSVGPGLAPLIGGALSEALGWRFIFAALSMLGAANLLLTVLRLPETGQRKAGITAATLLRDYLRLLSSPAFLGYAIGGACATTTMYAYLAAAPFIIVEELHHTAHEVGFCLAALVIGTSVGNFIANRLIGRASIGVLLFGASALGVVGATIFLVAVLAGWRTLWLFLGPVLLFTVAVGIASPMALTKSISVNPNVIGSAAGLYGSWQMLIGALCTALVGLGSDPALAAALILAGGGLLGLVAFLVAQRAERSGPARRSG